MSQLSNQLSTENIRKISEESADLLFEIYENLCRYKNTPPPLDVLYDAFKEKWITEMHDFITANADSWEFDINEVTPYNLADKLAELGFPVPSFMKVHNALNTLNYSYITHRGEMMNGAVVEVW